MLKDVNTSNTSNKANTITMTKTDLEEEISLPKATVLKMAQELLPDGLKLNLDTQDLVVAFALEFIQLLTFQANEICQKETSNGYIAPVHVFRACEELGFDEYVCEIQAVSEAYDRQIKTMQKKKAEKIGWWAKGGGSGDLALLQAQMLEKARERFEDRLGGDVR